MKEELTVDDGTFEVIARQTARLPHPNPIHEGKLVEFKTVNEVLLANDRRVYECNYPDVKCDFVSDNGQSVVSHQSTHNPNSHSMDYPIETIKLLLRTAKIEIRDRSHRGYAERTAEILNQKGLTQLNGEPFNAGQVSQLFRRWEPVIQVRVPSGPNGERTKKPAGSPSRKSETLRTEHTPAEAKIAEALAITHTLRREVDEKVTKITELLQEAFVDAGKTTEVDPEILAKAQKFDTMQQLMNGGK